MLFAAEQPFSPVQTLAGEGGSWRSPWPVCVVRGAAGERAEARRESGCGQSGWETHSCFILPLAGGRERVFLTGETFWL